MICNKDLYALMQVHCSYVIAVWVVLSYTIYAHSGSCEHLLEYIRISMVVNMTAHEHIARYINSQLLIGYLNCKKGMMIEGAA